MATQRTGNPALFVQEYVANGHNASAAAKAAGYSASYTRKACNLVKRYRAQIKQLEQSTQKKVVAQLVYTQLDHAKDLDAIMSKAVDENQLAVALKAAELKAKLCGLYVEQPQHPQDITITVKTSADLKKEQL